MYVRVFFGEPFPLRLGPHHERVHGPANARLRASCACRVGTCMRTNAARPLEPLVAEARRRRMLQQRQVGGCRRTVQVHRVPATRGTVRLTTTHRRTRSADTPQACVNVNCRPISDDVPTSRDPAMDGLRQARRSGYRFRVRIAEGTSTCLHGT